MSFDTEDPSACNYVTRRLKLKFYIQEMTAPLKSEKLNLLLKPQLNTTLLQQNKKKKCYTVNLNACKYLVAKLDVYCGLDFGCIEELVCL